MSQKREWREVYAQEALKWAADKTLVAQSAVHDGVYGEMEQRFTDGSALRVTLDPGQVYSEYTEEPARIVIEVSDP